MKDKLIIAKQEELIEIKAMMLVGFKLTKNETISELTKLVNDCVALESEPEPELYEKVYIKSEADLPEKVGNYLVILNNGSGRLLHFPLDGDVGFNVSKFEWLDTVDWYLQPLAGEKGGEKL